MKCWKHIRKNDHCHPPPGRTTQNSPVQQQAALLFFKCHGRDARCPYCILRGQIATKQIVEQQSIELIDRAKRRRLRWSANSAAASSSSIAYKYVSYENYAGTRPSTRRQRNVNVETVLIQLPKQMDPSFNSKMRRHIPERG